MKATISSILQSMTANTPRALNHTPKLIRCLLDGQKAVRYDLKTTIDGLLLYIPHHRALIGRLTGKTVKT